MLGTCSKHPIQVQSLVRLRISSDMPIERFVEGVTQGHCESVCGIMRLGLLLEIQQCSDHFLHLHLIGSAITYNGFLDLQRRVFDEWDLQLSSN